jgi:hypothetical protein
MNRATRAPAGEGYWQHQVMQLIPQPPQLFLSRVVPGMQGHG